MKRLFFRFSLNRIRIERASTEAKHIKSQKVKSKSSPVVTLVASFDPFDPPDPPDPSGLSGCSVRVVRTVFKKVAVVLSESAKSAVLLLPGDGACPFGPTFQVTEYLLLLASTILYVPAGRLRIVARSPAFSRRLTGFPLVFVIRF